jgi:hypothetical protein
MMIETLEKQDGRPHVVLDPFRASAPASAIQAPSCSLATALVGVCRVDCKSSEKATESSLLLQRLERLEAITTKLAQRLAILEQGSLPPVRHPSSRSQPTPPAMSRTLLKTRIRLTRRPLARSPAENSKAQSVATARHRSPGQALVTLTPADWSQRAGDQALGRAPTDQSHHAQKVSQGLEAEPMGRATGPRRLRVGLRATLTVLLPQTHGVRWARCEPGSTHCSRQG